MTQRRVFSLRAAEVRRKQISWLLPGRVPRGYLTLLIGTQGLGKSQWLAWLAAANSRGELTGEPGVTLVCSAEDAWDTTIKPRLEAWSADLELIRFVGVQVDDGETGLVLPDDVERLREEIGYTGAGLVTVDPVLAHLARDIDSHKDASTRQALAPLARMADASGCAVVGAHHLNKSTAADPLNRASASVAFTAQARSVLLFAPDPDDPDAERGPLRALAHVKSNVSALAATQLYTIEQIHLPATANEPAVETSRVRLTGESAHSGHELLRSAGLRGTEEGGSALDEAKAFLLEELLEGPVLQTEVARDARGNGIAEATLRRAESALGVEKQRRGFGKDGRWYWSLPLQEASSIDAQAPCAPMALNGNEHLCANPHEQGVSAPSETLESAIDAHHSDVSTNGF